MSLVFKIQSAWAVTNNVNFLASGRHSPASLGKGIKGYNDAHMFYTALGSGIYIPSGPMNYTYDSSGGSKLITSIIPKRFEGPIFASNTHLIFVVKKSC